MKVRRTPGVVMIAPGIRAGPDCGEDIVTVIVGEATAGSDEVGIERRRVIVARVQITAGCVGLPELYESPPYRTPIFIEHAASDDDSLPLRFSLALAREVVVCLADRIVTEQRPGHLRERMRERDQRLRWRTPVCGLVVGIVIERL